MSCVFLSVIGFLADRILKNKSEDHELPLQGITKARQPYFSNYHNYGAAMNFGERKPLIVHTVALMMTVFCTILFLATLGKKGSGLLKAGLSLLLGGAYSNLYDRLKHGFVIDYIALQLPKRLQWKRNDGFVREIVFNLADLSVAAGAMLLALHGAKEDEAV